MQRRTSSQLGLLAVCSLFVSRGTAQIPTNPAPYTPAKLIETIAYDRSPEWKKSLRAAKVAGLWTLRDESQLPPPYSWTLDGWGMFVELRDGKRYRAYQYSNPDVRISDPEGTQATAIVSAFRPIKEAMRRDSAGTPFRGLYLVSEGRNEFTACGSDLAMSIEGRLPLQTAKDTTRMYVEFKGVSNINWVELDFRREFHIYVDSVIVARPWTPDACIAPKDPDATDRE
jgi:hypothetical protein